MVSRKLRNSSLCYKLRELLHRWLLRMTTTASKRASQIGKTPDFSCTQPWLFFWFQQIALHKVIALASVVQSVILLDRSSATLTSSSINLYTQHSVWGRPGFTHPQIFRLCIMFSFFKFWRTPTIQLEDGSISCKFCDVSMNNGFKIVWEVRLLVPRTCPVRLIDVDKRTIPMLHLGIYDQLPCIICR